MVMEYFRIGNCLFRLLRHLRWSSKQLCEYQNRRLRKVVHYAYAHVPFYHEKFKRFGLKPDDVRTVDDLVKLPLVRRRELQENACRLISNEFDVDRLKRVSTSGSSGQPLFTYITSDEDAFRKAKLLRANIACGQRPRDRWVVITAPQHQAESRLLQRLLSVFLPIPVSVFNNAYVQLSLIERLKPDVLDGYSSSLLILAREAEKRGASSIKPRIVIGGADLIENSAKRFIERIFGAPFYDEYACVELERLAWQCQERSGYHIDADSVVMEFVDENGERVANGESGEIVCTSLFNFAMPFIRYAVGDVGRASDEECGCGITLPLMEVLEGRSDSLVRLPDGRLLSPLVFGWAMEFYKFYDRIDQYRVVQKRINAFKILIKLKNSGKVGEKFMAVELVEHLRKLLNVGFDVTFDVEFVDDIPLDRSGKLRKVISEVSGT